MTRLIALAAMIFALSPTAWGTEPIGNPADTQAMVRAAVARVRPSVVTVETVGGKQELPGRQTPTSQPSTRPFVVRPGSRFELADGPTTGLIQSEDGYIITSSFSFVRNPSVITVELADGTRHVARLVARDQVRKVALLKIDARDLPVPEWKDLNGVHVGDWAIALGRGFGGIAPSISVGIVSGLNRMDGNAFQTDAKLSPANYGGPIVDSSGRVIGISVPMGRRPGELAGIELYDSGIGFAVPYQEICETVEFLKTGQSVHRGFLGIEIDRRAPSGAVISGIAVPSPAHGAGLHVGDIIVEAAGREIFTADSLPHALAMRAAGDTVNIRYVRGAKTEETVLTLARQQEIGSIPAPPTP